MSALDLRALVFLPPTPAPHANDGERMVARYAFADEADLRRMMDALGVELRVLPPELRVPARTVQEPSPIPDLDHLAQPGHVTVADVAVFVWVSAGFFEVTMVGAADPYLLDDADLERARRLDDFLFTSELEASRTEVPYVRVWAAKGRERKRSIDP